MATRLDLSSGRLVDDAFLVPKPGAGGGEPVLWTPADLGITPAIHVTAAVGGSFTLSGSDITAWADQVRGGYEQLASANKPTLTGTIGGVTCPEFNGTTDHLPLNTATTDQDRYNYLATGSTTLFIAKTTNASAFQVLLDTCGIDVSNFGVLFYINSDGKPNFVSTRVGGGDWGISANAGASVTAGVPFLASYVIDGFERTTASARARISLNGATPAENNTRLTEVHVIAGRTPIIGKHAFVNSQYFSGSIGLILSYSCVMDAANVQRLEGYYAHTVFGIASSLDASHPYKAAPPTV